MRTTEHADPVKVELYEALLSGRIGRILYDEGFELLDPSQIDYVKSLIRSIEWPDDPKWLTWDKMLADGALLIAGQFQMRWQPTRQTVWWMAL